jgi:hypothetical protein
MPDCSSFLRWSGDTAPGVVWPATFSPGQVWGLVAPAPPFAREELDLAWTRLKAWGLEVK